MSQGPPNVQRQLVFQGPRFGSEAIWLTGTEVAKLRHAHEVDSSFVHPAQEYLRDLHGVDGVQGQGSRDVRPLLKLGRQVLRALGLGFRVLGFGVSRFYGCGILKRRVVADAPAGFQVPQQALLAYWVIL